MSRLAGGRQSRVGWPALSQASGGNARGYKGPHSSRTSLLSFLSLKQAGPTAERSGQEKLLSRDANHDFNTGQHGFSLVKKQRLHWAREAHSCLVLLLGPGFISVA